MLLGPSEGHGRMSLGIGPPWIRKLDLSRGGKSLALPSCLKHRLSKTHSGATASYSSGREAGRLMT